jgi:REP element-mobilizing transposase RayT
VTFRLVDSLPAEVAQARTGEGSIPYRRRIEAALDSGAGACWFLRPECAEIVSAALRYGCGQTHDLQAFVVMPNHVHVLTVFRDGARLADIVKSWKTYSARRINAILGRQGALWQREYFDRFIRDESHFERVRAYIENNPVAAGLTTHAASWPFSGLAHP